MAELRAAKLIAAALLVATGAACVTVGDVLRYRSGPNAGILLGVGLLVVGIPMLVRQWTGRGLLYFVVSATLWLLQGRAWEQSGHEAEAVSSRSESV